MLDVLRFVVIPIVVGIVALLASRYAAKLAAVRRQVDSQIEYLTQFGEALIEAGTEAQNYAWYAERQLETIEESDYKDRFALKLVEPLTLSSQRLRFLAIGLPWPRVRQAHQTVDDLLRAMLNRQGGRSPSEIWNDAMTTASKDSDPISIAVKQVAEQRRRLLTQRPTTRLRPTQIGGCWACRTGRRFPEP